MPRVSWSAASIRDLLAIDTYLNQFHRDYGVRAQEALQSAARLLGDFPFAGPALSEDLRSLRVRGTSYRLIYRILSGDIEIARVRDVREDWRPE